MKLFKKGLSSIVSILVITATITLQPLSKTSAATTDKNNGDWSKPAVTLSNTDEAQVMVRTGDIDNFGYPWTDTSGKALDPFTGKETKVHGYPFNPESDDPDGTDRIMVVTGYSKTSGSATDGYTGNTANGYNRTLVPVTMNYNLNGLNVQAAKIQMFLDDVQPSKWVYTGSSWINQGRGGFSTSSYNQYQVTIGIPGKDPQRVPEFETVINNLDEHGPIGKLVTLTVPERFLSMISEANGKGLQIKIDDPRQTVTNTSNKTVANTGDGYAIDFVKLLINPNDGHTVYNATVTGKVYEASYQNNALVLDTTKPISGANITFSGVTSSITSDANGNYTCNSVPAGQVIVQVQKDGYAQAVYTIEKLESGTTLNYNIGLVKTDIPLTPTIQLDKYTPTNQNVTATINYLGNVQHKLYRINGGSWTDYTGPLAITDNCLIEAKSIRDIQVSGTQTKSFESAIASLTVSNIDKDIPAAPKLTVESGYENNKLTNVDSYKVYVTYPTGRNVIAVKTEFTASGATAPAVKTYPVTGKATGSPLDPNKISDIVKYVPVLDNGTLTVSYQVEAGNWSNKASITLTNFDRSVSAELKVEKSFNKTTLILDATNSGETVYVDAPKNYTYNGQSYSVRPSTQAGYSYEIYIPNGLGTGKDKIVGRVLSSTDDLHPGIVELYSDGGYTFYYRDAVGNTNSAGTYETVAVER